MPRYYFELNDGESGLKDRDGEEFEDLAAAAEHGRLVAYELARNHAPSRLNGTAVLVLDDTGAERARISLAEAVVAAAPTGAARRMVH